MIVLRPAVGILGDGVYGIGEDELCGDVGDVSSPWGDEGYLIGYRGKIES
jgi:hypothetical protein